MILALPILPWSWTSIVLPAMSPYVAICSTLGTRSVNMVSLVAVPVLLLALLWRRWFCRHLCPTGFVNQRLGQLRRSANTRFARLPHLGRWIVLAAVAGAGCGVPMFLWLDPLAVFTGFFGVWDQPEPAMTVRSLLPAIGLPVLLLTSLLLPNAWCLRLCPLGATQELLAVPGQLLRYRKPALSGSVNTDGMPLPRRSVFAATLVGLCGVFTWRSAHGRGRSAIRPPGAVAEHRFTGLCVRCGNCVRACPSRIIQPDVGEYGVAGFLAPAVRFPEISGDEEIVLEKTLYCHQDCHRCTQVCPSGAITRLALEEKQRTSMAVAKVDLTKCIRFQSIECYVCYDNCPYGAVSLVVSDKDHSTTVHIDADKCPGCGACTIVCPADPEKAISLEPRQVPLPGSQ